MANGVQQFWLSTIDAAAFAGCHDQTVRKALEAGELHGFQRKTRGRWRVHIDCLNAWLSNTKCPHAQQGKRLKSA